LYSELLFPHTAFALLFNWMHDGVSCSGFANLMQACPICPLKTPDKVWCNYCDTHTGVGQWNRNAGQYSVGDFTSMHGLLP